MKSKLAKPHLSPVGSVAKFHLHEAKVVSPSPDLHIHAQGI